jgi:predicted metalloenzyme YecM
MTSGTPNQQKAWRSLQITNILDKLKTYDATVVGTIPLDIDISSSDIDIICEANDLEKFALDMRAHFSNFSSFAIEEILVDRQPTIIVKFAHETIMYEIFAQAVPIRQQNAYLHMVIEALLLEIGGARSRDAIRKLKQQDLKTEPAFAKYFGIEGDPYAKLRDMALRTIENPQSHIWVLIENFEGPTKTPTEEAKALLVKLKDFSQNILAELRELDLLNDAIEIDHACYRVSTSQSYAHFKNEMATVGSLLSEANVNGRPIATYKLHSPIPIDSQYSIDVLELPSPKPGSFYDEGFEHVEVVLSIPLEEFMRRTHPHLSFDQSNLSAKINRDIALKLKSGKVKFHEHSLEQIIAQEHVAMI